MFDFLNKLKTKMDTGTVTNLAKECQEARKDVYIGTLLRGVNMVEKTPDKTYQWVDGEITQGTAEYVRQWTNYVKNGR